MRTVAVLTAGFCFASVANAQFITDFDSYIAGSDLNGQDNWYLPPVGGVSLDVVDAATNPWGFPANPAGGGANWVGGDVVQAGNLFGRSQRNINWGGTGVWAVYYDFAWSYNGILPATQNLASFSLQHSLSAAGMGLNLVSFEDPLTAVGAQHLYIYYDANNVQHAQPGKDYGPDWNNLPSHMWHRFMTVIDWDTDRVVCVSITNLATGLSAAASPPVGDPLLIQAIAGVTHPEGFRLFTGGTTLGNIGAWDNLAITCYADCEKDGDKDVFDYLCFLSAFAASEPYADCECDGDWDVFDFLCFQNRFGGCPL